MRADLSALALAVLFAFSGFGVLAVAGVRPSGWRGHLAALGPAYLCGLCIVLLIGVALLCAGVAIRLPVFAAVALAVGASGLLSRLRDRRGTALPPVGGRMPLAVLVAAVAVAALGYRWAQVTPLDGWDAWSIWARKATLLFDHGTLPVGFFTDRGYGFMHPDYPLLVPLLESVWFRMVAAPDTRSLHVEFWLLYLATFWTAGFLLGGRARWWVRAVLIGFVASIPAVTGQLMTMYADIPMGLLLMLGLLLLGMWLERPTMPHLALGVLFLAAAANVKNEGLLDAVCALVMAGAVTATGGRAAQDPPRRRLVALAVAGGGFLVAVAPWRLWTAAHGVSGDMPVGRGLDPGYLSARTGRIGPSLTSLYTQVSSQSRWSYLLPLAVALVLACLLSRRMTRAASFYLLTGVAVFAALLWAYLINPNPIRWYLATSAVRTVDGVMFVAAAAVLHLGCGLLTRDPEPLSLHNPESPPGVETSGVLLG